MTRSKILQNVPTDIEMLGGIDLKGEFSKLFKKPEQVPGCVFLLCVRGKCNINLNLKRYELVKGSLAMIYPEVFFQIIDQTPDCRFFFVAFSSQLIHDARIFPYTIEFTPYIFQQPILNLPPKPFRLFKDSLLLFIRMGHTSRRLVNRAQATISFIQIVLGLNSLFKIGRHVTNTNNRKDEMVRELIRLVVTHYKEQRSIAFYADQLHVSPQHLSTTIKQITGKTLTDIISTFIIYDAKAKLCSTELNVQEIAYSLNFRDISFFGKYFKRYTGMSPKQYRKIEK